MSALLLSEIGPQSDIITWVWKYKVILLFLFDHPNTLGISLVSLWCRAMAWSEAKRDGPVIILVLVPPTLILSIPADADGLKIIALSLCQICTQVHTGSHGGPMQHINIVPDAKIMASSPLGNSWYWCPWTWQEYYGTCHSMHVMTSLYGTIYISLLCHFNLLLF